MSFRWDPSPLRKISGSAHAHKPKLKDEKSSKRKFATTGYRTPISESHVRQATY